MGAIDGYVTVYEFSDGGTGDPNQTLWQFIVDPGNAPREFVTTSNHQLAETMRLAVKTNSRVLVSYKDNAGHSMEQARIEFTYVCESLRLMGCPSTTGPEEPLSICVTRRYSHCDPRAVPPAKR